VIALGGVFVLTQAGTPAPEASVAADVAAAEAEDREDAAADPARSAERTPAPDVVPTDPSNQRAQAAAAATEKAAARAADEAARKAAEAEAARKAAEQEAARKAAEEEAARKAAEEEAARRAAEEAAAAEAAAEAAIADAVDDPQGAARAMMADYGWGDDQFQCLDSLWTRESNWDHTAQNPSSGAYGIPQSLPGDKMATVGDDWRTNPVTQIRWGLDYIEGRYGNPCGAWAHSEANNWY
jgi:murein DD-endopeptidase MepM/ murein hydrolase activator NlpD